MAAIDHEKFAEDALVLLVGRVLSPEVEDKPITYGRLAKSIGFSVQKGPAFAGQIGKTLETMGEMIEQCTVQGVRAPEIQSLVIRQGPHKVPGPGFGRFHPRYKNLPLAEKQRVVREYQKEVYAFGDKWLDVLDQLNIAHELSSAVYPDEVEDDDPRIMEGAKKRVAVNQYERSPVARKKCIDKHGCKCSVCGFDFERKYGEIGKGFIHVHHIRELSEIGEEYEVDPVRDLRPVCPNCHAMIHRKREKTLVIEELKDIISRPPSEGRQD